jgi:uncharacterized protein
LASERDATLALLRASAETELRAAPDGERRWAHSERVYGLARRLARQEEADRFVVGAAALLHDWPGDVANGATARIKAELAALGLAGPVASAIRDAIAALDLADDRAVSREAQILRDADRLDDLGALGIATLLTGNEAGVPLYEREDPFSLLRPLAPDAALVERLYARLAALPRRMHTAAARQIALRRTGIMLFYLESLRDELAETIPDALLPEPDWLVPKEGGEG